MSKTATVISEINSEVPRLMANALRQTDTGVRSRTHASMVTHWIETKIRQSVKTTRHAIHRCVSKQTPCLARLYAVWHFVCGAVVKQRKIDQVQGNAKELRLAPVYCTTWVDFALHCSMVFPRVDRSGSGSMRRWMAATWHWHLVTEVTEQRTEVAASLRFVTSVLILGPKWP